MVEELPRSAHEAAQGIRVVVSRIRRKLLSGQSDGLTASQASVLARIANGEATTASALAALEGVRPQSMASILHSLEEWGLIRRQPDPDDGRRHLIAITSAGNEMHHGTRADRGERLARMLAEECSEDERQVILAAVDIMERLARA